MMKKILTLLVMVIGSLTAVKAQANQLSPIDTIYIDSTYSSNQTHLVQYFNLRNNSTTDTLKMNWRVSYNTLPHCWNLQVCDPLNCYTTYAGLFRYTFVPGQSSIMKLDIATNCCNGNGSFQIHTWATNDSVNTDQTLVWKVNATAMNCYNVGITDVETAAISIYPNPVKGQMNVSLPQSIKDGKLDVYNMIGSKVFSEKLNAHDTEQSFDLSNLDAGIYVTRISDNGKIVATKKFNKVD